MSKYHIHLLTLRKFDATPSVVASANFFVDSNENMSLVINNDNKDEIIRTLDLNNILNFTVLDNEVKHIFSSKPLYHLGFSYKGIENHQDKKQLYQAGYFETDIEWLDKYYFVTTQFFCNSSQYCYVYSFEKQ